MPSIFRSFISIIIGAAFAIAAPAEQLCVGQNVPVGADGRLLGHLPYAEAAASTLVSAPPGFALDGPCLVNRDMAIDLARMLAAARASLGPRAGASTRARVFAVIRHRYQ